MIPSHNHLWPTETKTDPGSINAQVHFNYLMQHIIDIYTQQLLQVHGRGFLGGVW
jgi:hypothetical protein